MKETEVAQVHRAQMHTDIALHRAAAALGLVSAWADEWPQGYAAMENIELAVKELSAAQVELDELAKV